MASEGYLTSSYLQILDLRNGFYALGNSMALRRTVVSKEVISCLRRFMGTAATAESLARLENISLDAARALIAFLVESGYLVKEGVLEAELFRKQFRNCCLAESKQSPPGIPIHQFKSCFDYYMPRGMNDLCKESLSEMPEVRFLVLGSCMTQSVVDVLEREGRKRGLRISAIASWPSDVSAIEREQPDAVIYQPASTWLLGTRGAAEAA